MLGALPSGRVLVLGLLLSLWVGGASAETWVWVDEQGSTHLTDDPARAPETQSPNGTDWEALGGLWSDGVTGPVLTTPLGGSGGPLDRVIRILQSALSDLERGERARAAAALRGVLRLDPDRPEPHWYLAELNRERGRYGRAADHLEQFLSLAGPELHSWRKRASGRLVLLRDEQRLADPSEMRDPLHLLALESPHFDIRVDAQLDEVGADFARRAVAHLERARDQVKEQLGSAPTERLGVVFYGRAAYTRAHAHRFSFRTVGFFDGRIHVAAPAHPSDALGAVLFHEYSHAIFRAKTGGDRPYWLNEGLAVQAERLAVGRPVSSRSERAALRTRLETGGWLALKELAAGFSGLSDDEARAAYLQSVIVMEWITTHTSPDQRGRVLELLGAGLSADQALHAVLGVSTDRLEDSVQADLRAEFSRLGAAAVAPLGASQSRRVSVRSPDARLRHAGPDANSESAHNRPELRVPDRPAGKR